MGGGVFLSVFTVLALIEFLSVLMAADCHLKHPSVVLGPVLSAGVLVKIPVGVSKWGWQMQ